MISNVVTADFEMPSECVFRRHYFPRSCGVMALPDALCYKTLSEMI
ncbi:hypothetical protein NEICINOT_05031 [Neisseria cinerea ATCC 14685]|uniref:Uncharacterized protein n=1 Tax=Neisseria cinerea ATCC 14685 TaxID=546262 RepID=D0W5R2_NEICI|nr:hypothetical protein NEICINOT_05031 [Neisseria cinerea ATCC 14685]